jgi:putative transposase
MVSQETLMKKSRFSEQQIINILKQAGAGVKVQDLCRQPDISDATYYKWKSKCGGMEASDIKRLRDVEADNGKPKRMFADMALVNRALRDLIEKKL